MTKKFQTLEQADLTKAWTLEQRAALAHFLEEEKHDRSKTLYKPNDKVSALHFISSGSVRLHYQNIETDLSVGQTFGELSLLYPTKKQARVTALDDLLLYSLSEENWTLFRRDSPATALKLLESIGQKFAAFLTHAPAPPGSFGTKSV